MFHFAPCLRSNAVGIVIYIGNLPLSDLQYKSLEIFAKETTNSADVDGDYAESLIEAKKSET